jgi:sugar transferase (PEP-CTERM/EpsH1 system associated)
MRILVVTTKSPYPLFEGRALRTYNLIRQVARQHEVHLVSFVQTVEDLEGLEHMRSICGEVEGHKLYFTRPRWRLVVDAVIELFSSSPLPIVKYRSAAMTAALRARLAAHQYDLVHFDMLHLSEYFSLCGQVPTLLMEHNVESNILARRADTETRPLHKFYLRYQQRKLRRFEAEACRNAGQVVAVSELDARELARMSGRHDIRTVPNGVDVSYFKQQDDAPRQSGLVFVGTFDWFPNADAMRYFVNEVFPLILKVRPDTMLTIIGKHGESAAAAELARHPQIRLAGLVDDIRPWLQAAAVYVVPLRIGGGTRLKILDALAMSKAIVSTSVGCEGLHVTDGQDIIVADQPDAFARQVLGLLSEGARAQSLGRRGRELVERQYDWRVIADSLLQAYQNTITGKPVVA